MYAKKKTIGMKTVVLLLTMVLLVGFAVGGTIAYLITSTGPIQNTFVSGNIGTLTLAETAENPSLTNGKFVIVPGKGLTHAPAVTYTAPTENNIGEVYIFITVSGGSWTYNSETNKFTADELSWTVDSNWSYLKKDGSDYVFYRTTSGTLSAPIISGSTITVNTTIQEGTDMDAAVAAADGLTFKAYAIQAEGFDDATAAWAQAKSA